MDSIGKENLRMRLQSAASDFSTLKLGMLSTNRNDLLLEEIIDLKMQSKMLPITMRKIYAYKIASIKKKLNDQKVIPLVMRKRMLYESAISA